MPSKVEMEIKHGRLAMAGFVGVLTTYSGIRWPGYLSTSENIQFSDIPGGAISSWAALPTAAWFQIVLIDVLCDPAGGDLVGGKVVGCWLPKLWKVCDLGCIEDDFGTKGLSCRIF